MIEGNIPNTRDSVSSGYPRRQLKIRRAVAYFDESQGVWIADETLPSFLYIFSIETKTKG